MIKIICDLMGADKAPSELVSGAIMAVNEIPDLCVNLCVKGELVQSVLDQLEYDKSRVEITECGDPITNNDIPTKAFRRKPDSSLVKGLNLCKTDPMAGGFVSCGATGGVLVSSMFILGTIGEVRPALACVLGGTEGSVCLCDCGANVDCKPEQIVDFAKMGVAYMQAKGISNPRVRLLSNGAEEKKGTEAVKLAHQMLKGTNLNFLGNVEGKEVLMNTCDVVACDGFGGNMVLKTIEGAAKTIFMDIMHMAKGAKTKEEADILKNTVMELLNKYDYNTKGGAILLGVKKPVVKGHGAAEAETLYSIIKEAYSLAKGNMISHMEELLG